MRILIDPARPEAVTNQTMATYKQELCEALAPASSAVLLDPIHGTEHALARGVVPRDVGVAVSAEDDCVADEDGARLSELLPDWSAERARRLGADGARLVIYYHPGHSESAAWQLRIVERFAGDCGRSDLPCIVAAFTYALDAEAPKAFARRRTELILESARQVTALGVDLLATEFPGDVRATRDDGPLRAACHRLDAASHAPWILLSAGVSYDEFTRQLRIACEAGACGFVAGRVLWEEAFSITDVAARRRWLETVAASRLRRLADVAREYGRPWWAGRPTPRRPTNDVGTS